MAYCQENPPPKNISNYNRDIFARCLETSLDKITERKESMTHKNYSKNLNLDQSTLNGLLENLNHKPNQPIWDKASVQVKDYISEIMKFNFN